MIIIRNYSVLLSEETTLNLKDLLHCLPVAKLITVNVFLSVFSRTNPARTLQPISSNCTLIHKSRYVDKIFDAIQSNNVESFCILNLYHRKKKLIFRK
jgi:hypothetical protein